VIGLDYSKLIEILQNPPSVPRPIVLPDFFFDHFVIEDNLEDLLSSMKQVAKQGGGNIVGSTQFIRRGGNAVNTAAALYTLGVDPQLIVTTDEYGASLLKSLVRPEMDLSLVHTNGRMSSTVSIEAEYQGRRVNLMLSDSGSVAEFSFSDLTENDLSAIRESGLIALVNLSQNRCAVELAERLFTMVHDESNATTFMDICDPSHNLDLLEPLTKRVLTEGLVDILGMNENEATWLAWSISGRDNGWRRDNQKPEDWLEAAKYVSHETGIRVDFHTPSFSATLEGGKIIGLIPAFIVNSKVICGAGDAWNAGNIYGTLLELETNARLILANAVAAYYVETEDATHPSRSDVINFLNRKIQTTDITDKLLS
jgi:sugar/nucleoside kinase (ribokinase family)